MMDPILAARIDALTRHLHPPDAPRQWPRTFPDAHVNESIWLELTRQMTRERQRGVQELKRLRERLNGARTQSDLEQLWTDYAKAYDASQDIFRESREIMGGLAFREKGTPDAELCQIAEDIVLDCSRNAGTIASLPVPGHEVVSRTLARVVRMRLPEWTLWTLPLVAREYGQVILDDLPVVAAALEDQIAPFAAADAEASDNGGERALDRARRGVGSLLADAFAAYSMGPAYGYAAVTLSLNPADRSLASHLRADVVCSVLERIGDNDSGAFAAEVAYLRDQWGTLQGRIGAAAPTDHSEIVTALAKALTDEDEVRELRYPISAEGGVGRSGSHGYEVAKAWANRWLAATGGRLPELSPSAASSIRDVLNAAWLARIEVSRSGSEDNGDGGLVPEPGSEEDLVGLIEQAALRLCMKIVELHEPPRPGTSPGRTDGGPR